ncbi:hypothetical protein Taro_003305 [Colocasia esculenta]|uniref:HTH myb-type domain-containing protein n=1 Tax=Colocasia esculenta TaxID=4460 RepID=A0A843TLQ0_COLES|nr:hypothetical protein [Colocasia esculenta]
MGEEAGGRDYDVLGGNRDGKSRVIEWVDGLPSDEDLIPLSQALIPQELASAFSITPELPRTVLDVHRASKTTMASLRRQISSSSSSSALKSFPSFAGAAAAPEDPMVIEGDESGGKDGSGESSHRMGRPDGTEEADSALRMENFNDESSAKTLKRPRLVWTPQLHRRFVDVVAHLGIKNAVPKTIMQLMNVEGLTRENVASHLQKYRLYLKRMQGSSSEGPSSTDHLFASTPVPQNLQEAPGPVPMPYAPPPALIPMPVLGMAHHGPGAPVAMVPLNGQHGGGAYHGYEAHHPYAMFGELPKDWPGGNKFAPMVPYPHVTPHNK